MADPATLPGKRRRLGELLVAAGLLSDQQLKAALAEQRRWGGKLGRTLIEMGFVDESSMALALSKQLALPLVDLDKARLPNDVVQHLRVDMAERYGVFPVGGDPIHKTIQLATSDPTNADALKELAFYTGMRIQPHVCAGSAIDRAIRRYYYGESPGSAPRTAAQGVNEQTFELDDLAGTRKMPVPLGGNGAQTTSTTGSKPVPTDLAKLTEQVARLEKLLTGQLKVMRGMLELMVEKGYLTREEYLAKVRSQD